MADKPLEGLTGATLPLASTDLFYVVQDVSTTTFSRKIAFVDLTQEIIGATTVPASNVIFNNIPTPTFKTGQDWAEVIGSSGALAQGTHFISDAGGGNINVAAGSGLIRTGNTPTAPILFFDWPASNGLAIPSNTTRFVGIIYNAGSPIVAVHTTNDFTGHDSFILGSIVNEAGTLHINHDPVELADYFDHALKRWYQTRPLARDERQGGLIIGNVGTRNFSLTAGTLWDRLNEFPISSLSTNVSGTFDRYYRDGSGGFTKEAAQTQWGNTQYDDGTGTLATMAANRWANVWWYVENDSDVVMLYGRNQYTSQAAAALETPPATVPARITDAGILLGRFVFQKSAGSPAQVDSVFTTVFQPTAVADHANLANLAWTSSGHTGTAFTLPYFQASTGAAGEITIPNDTTKFLRGDATFQTVVSGIDQLTGDVTAGPGSGSQAATIGNAKVTLAKIANAAANSKVLGSGASGAGASYVELTLGANLSMSGTTLNASGSGGGINEVGIVTNSANTFTSSGTSTIVTMTAPTAGDNLIAIVSARNRGCDSITQTNVVWTKRYSGNGNGQFLEIWTGAVSASAGTTATFAFTGADSQLCFTFVQSGVAAFTSATQITTNTSVSTTTCQIDVTGLTRGTWMIVGFAQNNPSGSYSMASQQYAPLAAFGGAFRGGLFHVAAEEVAVSSICFPSAANYFAAAVVMA